MQASLAYKQTESYSHAPVSCRVFQHPASPTASQSHLILDTAAWTSGQASCQGCGDPSLERCDGVGDVPLGSEGHVPLVCKLREEQLFRSSRHSLLLRGGSSPARRSERRRRRCTAWHGGGSRA